MLDNAGIKKAIADRATVTASLLAKFERYKATDTGVPIFSRVVPSTVKVNNRLNADFVGDVVDTKVGYLVGNPVQVKYTSRAEGDTAKQAEEKTAASVISDFSRLNNLPDVDAETVKIASICGWAARLLYIDDDGFVRVLPLKPYSVIPVFNRAGDQVIEALRFWTKTEKVKDAQGKESDATVTYVEHYTPEKILYFRQEADGDFEPDTTAREDKATETDNLFAPVVPIIVTKNNEELLGDCDKVLTMIDAYDRALSDFSSEIEQFRLAYLLIKGARLETTERDKMLQSGAIEVPEGATIEWLTKTFTETTVGALLTKLEKNIIRFAKSVDFTDSNFYGNLTRMAIAFKLWNLETKARTLELKLGTSFRQMWRAVFAATGKKAGAAVSGLDPLNIEFVFTRNVPINATEEANEQKALVGLVSDRSRLARLSFVKDADAELEQMKKERDEKVAEGDYSLGGAEGDQSGNGQGDGSTGQGDGTAAE